MAIPTVGSLALVTVDPAGNGGADAAACQVVRTWQENIPDPSYRPQDEHDRAPLVAADLAAVVAYLTTGQVYLPRVFAAGSRADADALIGTHRRLVPKVREGGQLIDADPAAVFRWVQSCYPADSAAPATAPAK